jgi:uncharacterized membrane protein
LITSLWTSPDRRPDFAAALLLGLATVLYTGLNTYRLAHFYALDFDLAIFGQGVWLLSRGETPFVTIRGLNLFGEHATWIHLPVAVLYAILGSLADVRVLVFLQSGALALAGLFLYRIARRELGAALAVLVLLSYLAYPALQHTWLEFYEPVNLAVPCLVAATQAVRERRDRPAFLWSLIALATVENIAATVAALGLLALVVGRRRLGLVLIAVAAAYVALIMRVTFPWLSAHGYVFADRLYGDFARSLPEAAVYLARPDHLLGRLFTVANGQYLLGLFVPVAFLPLAAPVTLVAAAQLPLNLVSSWPYAHEIRYHYVAPIIPFVFLSLIRALALCPPASSRRRWAAGALVIGLLAGQWTYRSAWIVPPEGQGHWRGREADATERTETRALLDRLPSDASVSVHYRFLPALCQRSSLFMFPDTGPRGTWPDALVLEEGRLATSARDLEAFERARTTAAYWEAGRTSSGTVLLFRGGWTGSPPEPSPLRRSPPVARPMP